MIAKFFLNKGPIDFCSFLDGKGVPGLLSGNKIQAHLGLKKIILAPATVGKRAHNAPGVCVPSVLFLLIHIFWQHTL